MNKKVMISLLFTLDCLIIILGIVYSVYSYRTGDIFIVLKARIPGYIFGAAVIFIGIRYMRGIFRLRKNISLTGSRFEWKNFSLKSNSSKVISEK